MSNVLYLLSTSHLTSGFPVYPERQVQVGEWLTVLHSALIPHAPGQGSLHLLLEQALLRSQSELDTHSGRQPVYGSPKYSGKQAHEPTPFLSLQRALAPQGEGLQGFGGGSDTSEKMYISFYERN